MAVTNSPPGDEMCTRDHLIAAGMLVPAEDPSRKAWLVPPLPAVPLGEPTLSEILQQMRDEERY
jgi:hypothetical protein